MTVKVMNIPYFALQKTHDPMMDELDAAYRGEEIPDPPSPEEIREMMIRHLDMLASLKGEHVAVREFRKYIMRYTKGMKGASSLRRSACEITDIGEMRALIAQGNEK